MIYFAHRGASARRVQNTLEAFRLARRLGASCYELDVHLTQDGQLVVHHDYSLLATAGKDAKIGELPWAQLRRCALQNRFDGAPAFIPTRCPIYISNPSIHLHQTTQRASSSTLRGKMILFSI